MTALADPLPLRDTSAWPGYDAITILPRVYGRARVKPLRYDESGTLYVLADHALSGVDAVTVDDQPVSGFRWRNGADVTGHAVALLELASAPDTSANLVAEVRGLSGNPADIIADLYPRAQAPDFAVHCCNAGLELGGAITERMTVRAALDFVLNQVGAVWSAGLPGFAKPFPPSADDPIHAVLGPLDLSNWSAECGLERLITRLSVTFDEDGAEKKARQSLVLEAPESIRAHGLREGTLALPWVRTARQALATATTWLHWRARPVWTLQADIGVTHRGLPPGGWISLSHPRLPQSGEYVITDLDPGYGQGAVSITAQAPAGPVPAVTLTRQSAAFAPIRTDYIIQPGAQIVTLTVTDPQGKKLPGSRVWVDGKGPITADAAAQVRFRANPGRHVLRIQADGVEINTEISL